MTGGGRKRRNDDRNLPIDEDALAAGMAMMLIAGGVATVMSGSWLPSLGTLAAWFLLATFSRWYNSRKK